ncbi:hypothetical protein F6X40_11790 [Paraburkholderia sp. UCT31]|uniref:hypothetical protein n=1 Tax=Paraburkholderia sp. UCT31 TaxID=2615209 RepID=UPI00165602F6|nr:hypothetical protein [Paraburkholderia sp. UCT31]MBC8737486.1 hypothetical protein [Paraburkholderia sp. UCT31]
MPATIRAAKPADTGAIFALTYELAQFENLTHIFVATEDSLRDALFGSFYQKMGATVLPDWRVVRVTGDALVRLAARA